jgi:hypothetical protein
MASRRVRALSRSAILVGPVLLLELAASLSWPGEPASANALRSILPVALVADVLLIAVLAVATAVGVRRGAPGEASVDEEPLMHPIAFQLHTRERPVVGVVGLQPEAGASTIAYNLATLVGVEGRVRGDPESARPLPVCLLSEGTFATNLGLSATPVREYLKRHPADVGDDLLALVTQTGPWLDALALPAQRIGRGQLSRIVAALRRHYDAVIVECDAADRFLAAALADEADLLLLCVRSQADGMPAETTAAANGLLVGRENKTVLLRNRQTAHPRRDHALSEFSYRVDIPDDPEAARLDAAGRPWILWHGSRAGGRLRELAMHALPRLFREAASDAA